MKRLTPSTRGDAKIVLRHQETSLNVEKRYVKFMSVRENVNTLLKDRDILANPVLSVEVFFTYPSEGP